MDTDGDRVRDRDIDTNMDGARKMFPNWEESGKIPDGFEDYSSGADEPPNKRRRIHNCCQ